jgi:hypothetical protein
MKMYWIDVKLWMLLLWGIQPIMGIDIDVALSGLKDAEQRLLFPPQNILLFSTAQRSVLVQVAEFKYKTMTKNHTLQYCFSIL